MALCLFQFLGVWYQVQPDLDSNDVPEQDIPSCESYSIRRSADEPNQYVVRTKFEIYPETSETKPIKYESTATNYLTAFDDEIPAMMQYTPTSGKH